MSRPRAISEKRHVGRPVKPPDLSGNCPLVAGLARRSRNRVMMANPMIATAAVSSAMSTTSARGLLAGRWRSATSSWPGR